MYKANSKKKIIGRLNKNLSFIMKKNDGYVHSEAKVGFIFAGGQQQLERITD